jgi:hypothetical protein
MEALILVAEQQAGPTLIARIDLMRAPNHQGGTSKIL